MLEQRRDTNALKRRMGIQESKTQGPTLGEFRSTFYGPALRALWFPGVATPAGSVPDVSGQSAPTVVYTGNPLLSIYRDIVPYYALDGTGDYFSAADNAVLDVFGTETYVAAAIRGLTLGGWFWSDSLGSRHTLISKSTGIEANTNYWLEKNSDDKIYFRVSDGVTFTTVISSAAVSANTWYFVVGRYTPSTELAVFLLGEKSVNVTSIPAALVNGNTALNIGSIGSGTNLLTGRWALAVLAAAAWPDDLIMALWMRSRAMFGV